MVSKTISQAKRVAFSKTAKNIYWTFVGNGFYTIFTFVFTVLLVARILGPEGFGRFSALFAFIILLAELSDIGIGPSLSRFIPPLLKEGKSREVESITRAAFQFETVVALFFTIVVFFLAPYLSTQMFDGTDTTIIRASSIGIIGIVLFLFSFFTLSAREQFKHVAILGIFISLSRVLLALFFIIFGNFTLFTALFSVFFPAFVTWLFSFQYFPRTYLSFKNDKGVLKKLFSFSKFIGINKIFTAITSRLDILMLIALTGAFESGIYSAAIRITQVYALVAGSLLSVLAPRFSVYHTISDSWNFTKKVIMISFALLGSIVVFFVIAKPFLLLVFGADYEPSIPVFKALLVPMVFFVLQLPFTGLVVYTLKKPQVFALSAFFQLMFVAIGNYLFIPRFGVFGPVFGLSFGYASALVILISGVLYFGKEST